MKKATLTVEAVVGIFLLVIVLFIMTGFILKIPGLGGRILGMVGSGLATVSAGVWSFLGKLFSLITEFINRVFHGIAVGISIPIAFGVASIIRPIITRSASIYFKGAYRAFKSAILGRTGPAYPTRWSLVKHGFNNLKRAFTIVGKEGIIKGIRTLGLKGIIKGIGKGIVKGAKLLGVGILVGIGVEMTLGTALDAMGVHPIAREAITGATSGAIIGFMVGGPIGAAIGAAIGAIVGVIDAATGYAISNAIGSAITGVINFFTGLFK